MGVAQSDVRVRQLTGCMKGGLGAAGQRDGAGSNVEAELGPPDTLQLLSGNSWACGKGGSGAGFH